MASLQLKGDTWYCQFMFKRERHTFTVGKVEEFEARTVAAKVDYWLMRVKQNLVQIPPGCTLLDFVRYDGKPPDQPTPEKKPFTLANLRDEYLTLHAKVLDARTVGDMKGHWKHLTRLLGEKAAAELLTLAGLQNYVIARVGEGVEGATAKKEVVTLRTCWNWAVRMDMLKGAFPNKGLRFPKGQEKPPFMTFAEVSAASPPGRRRNSGRACSSRVRRSSSCSSASMRRPLTRGSHRCSGLPPTPGPGGVNCCESRKTTSTWRRAPLLSERRSDAATCGNRPAACRCPTP